MATTNVKFFKGAYGSTAALAKSKNNVGGIVFDTTSKQIYVDENAFGGNITDVTFDTNKLLTITKADNTTIKLDFSDTASAEATMNVFARLNKVIGKNVIDGGDTLDYSTSNYLKEIKDGETVTQTGVTNLVDADLRLDSKIKAINDTIEGMDLTATDVVALNTDKTALQAGQIKEEDGKVTVETKANVVEFNQALSDTNKVATMKDISDANITIDSYKGAITTGNGLNAVAADDGSFSVKAKDGGYISVTADGVDVQNVDTTGTSTTETDLATVKTVNTAIEGLAVTDEVQAVAYTAATDTTGAKLVFNGIEEEDGKIKTGDGTTELQFAKVATTGAASDVSVTYDGGTDNNTVQKAITNIDSRLDSLEALPTYDVVVSKDAATTPAGIVWKDGETTITGTLAASADTMHKIYLVKTGTGEDSYAEYISVKGGTTETPTYTWEKVGNTAADLKGYVKTITVNGKDYTVADGTTKVTLGDVITTITGEEDTELNNTDYINVKATTADAADGSKVTTLSSSVKTTAIADAKAAEEGVAEVNGLATALDVKNTLKSTVEALDAEVTSAETDKIATVKVTEVDGKITAVNFTQTDATVAYTAATTEPAAAANLSATNATGVVTGKDVDEIKKYVDAKAAEASTVDNKNATITVNDTNATTIATVAGTDITAKAQLVWEEWS